LLDRVITVNLLSVGRLLTRIPQYMTRGGSVIVTSSTGAAYVAPGEFAYCASKAGLEGMVRVAAHEYAARHIRVNSVRPGPIATDMTTPETEKDVPLAIPAGRLGEPDELAALYLLLAGDSCTFITGASIAVDGGETLGLPPILVGR
jgi:3-oxoacyl-[acyl-carrier protein] reductase